MSVNVYDKSKVGTADELTPVATMGRNRVWTGTKAAAEAAMRNGDIGNGTVVYITDDYDDKTVIDTANYAVTAGVANEAKVANKVADDATNISKRPIAVYNLDGDVNSSRIAKFSAAGDWLYGQIGKYERLASYDANTILPPYKAFYLTVFTDIVGASNRVSIGFLINVRETNDSWEWIPIHEVNMKIEVSPNGIIKNPSGFISSIRCLNVGFYEPPSGR